MGSFDMEYVEKLMNEKKYQEAFDYCMEFANDGDAEAHYYIGLLWKIGLISFVGVSIDEYESNSFFHFDKAAKLGSAEGMYELSNCFARGIGTTYDVTQAIYWLKKSASMEYSEAEFQLGKCYFKGNLLQENIKLAIKNFQKASEKNHCQALYMMGQCFNNGWGIEENKELAVEYISRAANLGNAQAMYWLGTKYENSGNIAQAFIEYRRAAEHGDDMAMLKLARMYEKGSWVEKDLEKSVNYYIKSSEKGNSEASLAMGILCENGAYYDDPLNWYKVSVEAGNNEAVFRYGLYDFDNSGISNDYINLIKEKETSFNFNIAFSLYGVAVCSHFGLLKCPYPHRDVELYKKAVEYFLNFSKHKISIASFAIGIFYERGIVFPKSLRKAIKFYNKAVYHDNLPCPNAQYRLACLLLNGNGLRKNEKKAVSLLTSAAEQGHRQSQYRLALCYEHGTGIPRNIEKAMHWYTCASENGHQYATSKLKQYIKQDTGQNNYSIETTKVSSILNSMESRLMTKMDDTHRKVVEIFDTTKETNDNVKSLTDYIKNELPSKIASLRTEFGVDTISETELTEADEKKIGEFCKTVRAAIEKQFDEKNDLIRQSRKDLSNRFGNVWNRLCQETQNSLVSSMALWKAYKNIDDPNFDFSGICILATSALENELRKIFFEEFQEFVKNQTGGKINRYPSIFTYRKGTELVAGKSEYFALGKMPFLFGQTGKDPSSEDLSDIKRLNDFREKYLESIIDSQKMIDSGFASFSECFTKPFFSKNSELKKEKNFHVYYKGSLISEFEDIRNKYRNKSAHQGGLRRDEAHDCCNLVFGSSIMGDNDLEKVLGLIQKVYYLLKQ